MTTIPTLHEITGSSTVDAAGTDGEDLLVRFRSGGTYRYAGAAGHLSALRNAASAGSYVHKTLKGRFDARQE